MGGGPSWFGTWPKFGISRYIKAPLNYNHHPLLDKLPLYEQVLLSCFFALFFQYVEKVSALRTYGFNRLCLIKGMILTSIFVVRAATRRLYLNLFKIHPFSWPCVRNLLLRGENFFKKMKITKIMCVCLSIDNCKSNIPNQWGSWIHHHHQQQHVKKKG